MKPQETQMQTQSEAQPAVRAPTQTPESKGIQKWKSNGKPGGSYAKLADFLSDDVKDKLRALTRR